MKNTHPQAVETADKAPNATAQRIQKGARLAQSGKLKRAAEIFQSVLKSTPDEPDALHFYGIVLHQMGHPQRALSAIRKSLKTDPDNPHALNSLGNLLKTLEQYGEAEAAYRTALTHDPINAQCLSNLGIVQRNQGKLDDSIVSLREALRFDPTLPEAYHNLAGSLYESGQHGPALKAYRDSFKYGSNWSNPVRAANLMVAAGFKEEAKTMLGEYLSFHKNHVAAKFHLAALNGEKVERASDDYVTELFDGFASSFDGVLKGLDYRAPQHVADAVVARLGAPKGDKDVLDLGCGTGLCGPLVEPYKARLVGIDLSTEMLARAAKLGCYDDLQAAELQQFLRKQPAGSYDVIVCADTLVYLGALEKSVAGAATALRAGGSFVASVERLDGSDEDYVLGASGRFKHSRAYLERLAVENDLTVGGLREEVLRTEGGEPVLGYIVEYLRQ